MEASHFRKLEAMYLGAAINTQHYPSTTCTIEKGKAIIGIDINDSYFHALGAMHGSVYFKLLDDAAFFAVSSVVTDRFVLTTSFNTNIIRPINKGRIKAMGTLRFESKQLFCAEAALYNEQGKEIAFGSGNFVKSRIELSPEIGYV